MATQPVLMEERIESDNDEIDLGLMRDQIGVILGVEDDQADSEDEYL